MIFADWFFGVFKTSPHLHLGSKLTHTVSKIGSLATKFANAKVFKSLVSLRNQVDNFRFKLFPKRPASGLAQLTARSARSAEAPASCNYLPPHLHHLQEAQVVPGKAREM